MTKKDEDGGYYAIKGFEYQIDKAIFELLTTNNENQNINIEHIQDIDSNSFVMQVKYKETAKFTPCTIKEPVMKLINEFIKQDNKKYYLYAFFGDLNNYNNFPDTNKKISKYNLDKLLGNKKDDFTEDVKNKFVENFYLDFAPDYAEQFYDVISKIKALNFVGSKDDEAIFYYANIANFLRKLVINYKKEDSEKRSCTRKQVFEHLKDGRKMIFDSSFREYKGEQAYFKFIKSHYFTCKTPTTQNFERFIIIDLTRNESIYNIKHTVILLKEKYYKEQKRGINSGAPYIFLKNISDENLKKLKIELLQEGYIFKDGYDFYNANFSTKILIEPSTLKNKVSLKFLNTKDDFKKVIVKDLGKTKEIYQFFINQEIEVEEDIKHIKVQINNLSDLTSII